MTATGEKQASLLKMKPKNQKILIGVLSGILAVILLVRFLPSKSPPTTSTKKTGSGAKTTEAAQAPQAKPVSAAPVVRGPLPGGVQRDIFKVPAAFRAVVEAVRDLQVSLNPQPEPTPTPEPTPEQVDPNEVLDALRRHRLQAILADGDSGIIMIDGRTYRPGDQIEDFTIKSVQVNQVILQDTFGEVHWKLPGAAR